jgi:hypothetical protein
MNGAKRLKIENKQVSQILGITKANQIINVEKAIKNKSQKIIIGCRKLTAGYSIFFVISNTKFVPLSLQITRLYI